MVWGRRFLVAGVLVFLVVQLSEVGWAGIWRDLPVHPLFYLLFLGIYFGLPVSETIVYRLLWQLPFRQSFPVLLKKRVYNKDVISYSGEAHLYFWAKNRLDQPSRKILRDIKDNAVISSLTSMFLAITLLGIFMFAGLLPFKALIPEIEAGWLIGAGICAALLLVLAIRFRKTFIALPASMAFALLGLHLGRLLFVQMLQLVQWAVVMPEVPWSAWFTYLALQIVVNQLPLPAKDLIVVGASTDLSAWLQVSETGVVGMLLVAVVLDKVLNLLSFAYLSWRSTYVEPDLKSLESGDLQIDEEPAQEVHLN